MASTINAVLCAGVAVIFWTALGLPVARTLAPRSLAWMIAPALGWALFGAAALPVFLIVGFSATSVFTVSGIALVASAAALMACRTWADESVGIPIGPMALAAAGAALLAVGPAMAILPKISGDSVAFAAPMFDHAKIAIIDDIKRLGLPPGNPFFAEAGVAAPRLAYYYFWYVNAALIATLTGVTGWEADIAMTWFTAFSSLLLMIGFACWYSGRASTALWVLLLSLAGSVRAIFEWFTDPLSTELIIAPRNGFAGWLFQAAWVPQHMASATAAVLAVFVLGRLARRPGILPFIVFVLLAATTYESSTWIGAIVFPLAAAVAGAILLLRMPPSRRLRFLGWCIAAAVLAVMLAAPMLYDQYLATALRGGGSPIALRPVEVIGTIVPEPLRRMLDFPGYWIWYLPIELPAIYLAGCLALANLLRRPAIDAERVETIVAFAALGGASLVAAWLFVSTIGENNDLGWRAILPGVLVLTVFAAVGLSHWLARGARVAVAAAFAGLLLGLPDGIGLLHSNATGKPTQDSKSFAATAEMWAAVRRHTGPDERVADNPLLLEYLVPWPVNLSWALLANRRSCFAGRELTLAYTSLSNERRKAIDQQFIRVFEGDPAPDDLRELAMRYDCRVIAVTSQDKAWQRDPFASSPLYRLVESKDDRWRIYRSTAENAR